MTKDEFEKRVGLRIPQDDYEIIEKVYTYHPAIREIEGKEDIAAIFNLHCGMRIIRDMLPTAEKMMNLEKSLAESTERIREEKERADHIVLEMCALHG